MAVLMGLGVTTRLPALPDPAAALIGNFTAGAVSGLYRGEGEARPASWLVLCVQMYRAGGHGCYGQQLHGWCGEW